MSGVSKQTLQLFWIGESFVDCDLMPTHFLVVDLFACACAHDFNLYIFDGWKLHTCVCSHHLRHEVVDGEIRLGNGDVHLVLVRADLLSDRREA